MNPVLSGMAKALATLAALYIPRAYRMGKDKARRKYAGAVPAWGDADAANVEILLSRHGEELARTLAGIEAAAAMGEMTLGAGLAALANRSGSWSWVLSPALAMGLAAGIDGARMEISREEDLPPEEIGIIWYAAEDARVCKKCLYLAGRWFDAHEAYEIAATIHPNCRCPASFDIGTPSEALVGPIPEYRPGTAQDIYRDLGVSGLIRDREKRARDITANNSRAAYKPIKEPVINKPVKLGIYKPVTTIKTWNESDHPRDGDGKFTDGGSNSSPTSKPTGKPVRKRSQTTPSGKPVYTDLRKMGETERSKAIGELYDDALKHKGEYRLARYADVGTEEATKIKKDTGLDVGKYRHVINTRGIRHIHKHHGNPVTEAKRDQIAVTDGDIVLIPDIVANHDDIQHGVTKQGEDAIVYKKRLNGADYYYVEAVAKKTRLLEPRTMYRKKVAGAPHAVQKPPWV